MHLGSNSVPGRGRRLLEALAIIALFQASSFSGLVSASPEEYTYYGYVPREIWALEAAVTAGQDIIEYRIDQGSVMNRALVVILGNHEGTSVRVYELPLKALREEFTVNKLERVDMELPNGTFFKVVSSKPVTVILMEHGGFTTTFFTSTSGGYVGDEFVFMALQGSTLPETGPPFRVYALQDVEVTISDVNGSKVSDFKLRANEVRELSFKPLGVYGLKASGKVMLQSFNLPGGWWASGLCYYPSAEGGFVGTRFHGSSFTEQWVGSIPTFFILTSVEGSPVTFADLESKVKVSEETIPAGSNLSLRWIKAPHIAVESQKPVMLLMRESGLAFTGLKAGQTAYLYVPTETYTSEANLFAADDATVLIDDVEMKVSPDTAISLREGLHKVRATANVLVQVVSWPVKSTLHYTYSGKVPSFIRINDFGACIPSVQSLSMTYEDLRLKPVLGEELPWMYVGAAAVLAVVAVLVALKLRQRAASASERRI